MITEELLQRISARRERLKLPLDDFFPGDRTRMRALQRRPRPSLLVVSRIAEVLGVCPGALSGGCHYSRVCAHCGAESAPGDHACGAE